MRDHDTRWRDTVFDEGTKLPDNSQNNVAGVHGFEAGLNDSNGRRLFRPRYEPAMSRDKVAAFYKEQAVKNGWVEERDYDPAPNGHF